MEVVELKGSFFIIFHLQPCACFFVFDFGMQKAFFVPHIKHPIGWIELTSSTVPLRSEYKVKTRKQTTAGHIRNLYDFLQFRKVVMAFLICGGSSGFLQGASKQE